MDGDALVEELKSRGAGPAKVRYTHADMIDFIILNPWVSQGQLSQRYGYTQGWVSTVIASDAFQAALAARREEVVNPEMRATLEERFRALTIHSLTKLQSQLENVNCKPEVMLRAAELGAKALGLGGNAPPPAPVGDSLARLAERLITLQSNVRREIDYAPTERLQPQLIEGERVWEGPQRSEHSIGLQEPGPGES